MEIKKLCFCCSVTSKREKVSSTYGSINFILERARFVENCFLYKSVFSHKSISVHYESQESY
jgi:hypothetical protein